MRNIGATYQNDVLVCLCNSFSQFVDKTKIRISNKRIVLDFNSALEVPDIMF